MMHCNNDKNSNEECKALCIVRLNISWEHSIPTRLENKFFWDHRVESTTAIQTFHNIELVSVTLTFHDGVIGFS